jgi:phosphoglycerate dehydrogenase-like enzyme
MSKRIKVLVTAPFDTETARTLEKDFDMVLCEPVDEAKSLSEHPQRDHLSDAQVLIAELDIVDAATLDLAPNLKVVISCRAAPVNIDLAECEARGVKVLTTPARNADVTADLAFGLLLSTVRQLSRSEIWFRKMEWTEEDTFYPYREFRGFALNGRVLGIVGGGAIGRRMANRASGFGMTCLIYDPFLTQEQIGEIGKLSSLEDLLRQSDVVTIHAPLMDSTKGLIGAKELALMKQTAFLINAGRAAIIDEVALMETLERKKIAGAGFDVFWKEPVPLDHPVFSLDNVTMTPHIAGASDDVVLEHSKISARHLLSWLAEI